MTALARAGRTATSPSRLARSAPPLRGFGLDRLPPVQRRLARPDGVARFVQPLFRDHFELEFYVRRLAKNGVKLVSITREMGVRSSVLKWRKGCPPLSENMIVITIT
jgi:hypothetical protein